MSKAARPSCKSAGPYSRDSEGTSEPAGSAAQCGRHCHGKWRQVLAPRSICGCQAISYARHQFPPAVIQHAVWVYLRFTLSYRDVEDLLAERGLDVSYETVRRWVLKFGPAFAQRLRHCRPKPSRHWPDSREFGWRAVRLRLRPPPPLFKLLRTEFLRTRDQAISCAIRVTACGCLADTCPQSRNRLPRSAI